MTVEEKLEHQLNLKKRKANVRTGEDAPVKKKPGVIMPKRENTIGIVYIKDNKVYIANKDKNNDYLIESIEDIKKLLTIKNLKGPVV